MGIGNLFIKMDEFLALAVWNGIEWSRRKRNGRKRKKRKEKRG
jgi:hypothetical protein